MSQPEINWREKIDAFDANEALAESRILWLKLGVMFRDIVEGFSEFLERPQNADEAMAWAARAEACMWRATGDADAIDADRFIPELASHPLSSKESDK